MHRRSGPQKDPLLWSFVSLHVLEYALEALIGDVLVFHQLQLNASHLLEHGSITRDEVTHLDEAVHDADTHLYCGLASKYCREHGDALLSEHSMWLSSAAPFLIT